MKVNKKKLKSKKGRSKKTSIPQKTLNAESTLELQKNKASQEEAGSPRNNENELTTRDIEQRSQHFLQCAQAHPRLKDKMSKEDDKILLQLPEGLYGKFIVKSAEYLAEEWLTLRPNSLRLAHDDFHVYILMDQLKEESYETFCSELNECIEHFLARN